MSNFEQGHLSSHFTDKHTNGLPLEEIVHNYYTAAKMYGNDDAATAGIRINQSGRINDHSAQDKKEEKARHNLIYMAMLNDIQTLEKQVFELEQELSEKYGEDFAENLAAEHLDEETYMRLMAIQDKDDRLDAIAKEFNKRFSDGSLDRNDIDNPELINWLDTRNELDQAKNMQAEIEQTNMNNSIEMNHNESNELDTLILSI